MSKLDGLRRATGGNVAESMGKGVTRSSLTHGASTPEGKDRWTGVERLAGAQRIPVERIARDPAQPREVFAELELAELTESIRTRGILQPIRVRWDEGMGTYVIIAGERRFRAAHAAGLRDVPAVVHDGPMSDSDILLDQLAENLIRLDLEPIEQARAFQRLMDANGWSARRLAEVLHIDHDKVNRAVRLLELPASVQEAVAGGAISPTVAYEVSKLADPRMQAEVARLAVAEGLNRLDVVEAVRARSSKAGKGRGGKAKPRPTSVTIRTRYGKVMVENHRGVDDSIILAALDEATATFRAKLVDQTDAA